MINTERNFDDSRRGGFRCKPHSIWRNSLKAINESGPRYPDWLSVAEEIAFYNFFQRPAKEGKSLEHIAACDVQIANEVLQANIKSLAPSHLVFLSKKAFIHLTHEPLMRFVNVPHPSTKWWWKASRAHGGLSGHDKLAQFMKHEWSSIAGDDLRVDPSSAI